MARGPSSLWVATHSGGEDGPQYGQVVQPASREGEDAPVAHRKAREIRLAQERLVTASQRSFDLATLRRLSSPVSYLDVLVAGLRLFSAGVDLIRTQQTKLVAVVQVYKTLAGEWISPECV